MMRRVIGLAAGVLLAGCEMTSAVQPVTFEWFGTMTVAEGWEHLEGEAVLTWTEDTDRITVGAALWGDEVQMSRPWHLHHNSCAEGGGIVGEDGHYPRLVTSADGQAVVITDVPASVDPEADYHVNVHLSTQEMETIIACADMNPLF